MELTVFTPTYNRAYCLDRLYKSLCEQTCKSFEWLVIDDGSIDNTKELIDSWVLEQNISIRYVYQENAGKSAAHNKGTHLTRTELFICVDSDDVLTPDAVEIIVSEWSKSNPTNTGLLFEKFDILNNVIVTKIPNTLQCATLYDAYNKYGMSGDAALVFRSAVIKQFEFPHFEGEKFVSESYLYDLIDTCGTLRIVKKTIYLCEYMTDGYTNNMMRLLKNNAVGYLAYVNQRLKIHDKTVKMRLYDSARYVAMKLSFDRRHIIKDSVYPLYTILSLPIGYLLYVKKYRNI